MIKLLTLLVSGLMLGCIYGLIALGYSLIYKASGLLSFVQGDIMTLGAFMGLTFYSVLGLPFALSFVLTIFAAFVLGVIFQKGVIQKLLNRNVLAIYIVLATIAVSYIVQNGTQIIWGTVTLYFPSIFRRPTVNLLGIITVQTEVIMCVILSSVMMFLLHFFMTRTKLGTAMRASSMDSGAAESCGIDVSLTTGITWGVSAGLAALAGILVGPIYGVYCTLGSTIGRKGFSGAVIGGYGNMYGAMIGGLILGVTEILVGGFLSSQYKNLIAYIVLILFLFVKPTGIMNESAIQDV